MVSRQGPSSGSLTCAPNSWRRGRAQHCANGSSALSWALYTRRPLADRWACCSLLWKQQITRRKTISKQWLQAHSARHSSKQKADFFEGKRNRVEKGQDSFSRKSDSWLECSANARCNSADSLRTARRRRAPLPQRALTHLPLVLFLCRRCSEVIAADSGQVHPLPLNKGSLYLCSPSLINELHSIIHVSGHWRIT